MIRNAEGRDAARIAGIYNYYISKTVFTFEETELGAAEMGCRIDKTLAARLPWIVIEDRGEVVGYAYATPWRRRTAYRFATEVSAYLAPAVTGHGLGSALYDALFAELRRRSLRMAIGGIALPNPASVGLHEKFGMEKVAHFKAVGFKFDRWIDVGYWQKDLGATLAPGLPHAQTWPPGQKRRSGE